VADQQGNIIGHIDRTTVLHTLAKGRAT
jgi:hypothetical protein